MLKNLIGVILVVLIVGVIGCGPAQVAPASLLENPGQKEPTQEEPKQEELKQVEIDAIPVEPVEQFLKEYYSLNSSFSVGEIIRVRGVVKEIIVYGSAVVVRLEPGYKKHYLECVFTKNSGTEKVETLYIGQEIDIEGELDEHYLTIPTRLINSVLLNW